MNRTVQKVRKKEENLIINDNDLETIVKPAEDFRKTWNGAVFLLPDSNDEERRFFNDATKNNLKKLKKCKMWFAHYLHKGRRKRDVKKNDRAKSKKLN